MAEPEIPDPQPPAEEQPVQLVAKPTPEPWPSARPQVIERTLAWIVTMHRMEFPDDEADDVLARLVITLAAAVAASFDPQ